MNDDYIFLGLIGIAIVFMLAIYAIGAISPFPTEVGEASYIEEFELGTVGYVSELPAKTYTLGNLVMGELQKENLKSIPRMDITNSLFGGDSKSYTINVDDWYFDTMEKVVVSFSVDNTNMYSDLVVAWNGKVIYQNKAQPRTYKIELQPQYIEEMNTLEIYTGFPGLMFWATSVYQLRDFSVELEYGPAKLRSFELQNNEIQSFKKGVFDFYGTGTGRLTAKVNGVEIYNKVPEGLESANFTFSDVPLNVGDNILALTSSGTVQLFDAEMKVYLLINEVTRQRDFTLDGAQYAQLTQGTHKGRVDYEVETINTEGDIRITLNNRELQTHKPVLGSNTVYFYSEEALEGNNRLEFSSTGSYEIGTARVGLERV